MGAAKEDINNNQSANKTLLTRENGLIEAENDMFAREMGLIKAWEKNMLARERGLIKTLEKVEEHRDKVRGV